MAQRGQHAAHAGGLTALLHVQFAIRRKLALPTVGTQIVWTSKLHLADNGDDGFGA